MRTTFRRQVTLVLCLLMIASLLIGVSFGVLFDRFVDTEKNRSMNSTASAVSNIVTAYSDTYLTDWDFRTNLSVAANASQSDILICSSSGEVQICARELQNCRHIGKRLSDAEVAAVLQKNTNISAAAIYGEERVAVAQTVRNAKNEPFCIVLVSVQESAISKMTGAPLRIFFMTALLVMAFVLLMTPFLTRRESKPIQIMAAAARQIAHGNLDVRVPTGNRVEEIEELAIAFNNMAAAVQNSETVRKEFVANVSHELKTPLAVMQNYGSLLQQPGLDERTRIEYAQAVSDSSRRLASMITNILKLNRLENQQIYPQTAQYDLSEQLCQALLQFENVWEKADIEIETDIADSVTVKADAELLSLVWSNLLSNAFKFTEPGGKVCVSLTTTQHHAIVRIADTGCGMTPEVGAHIFEKFYQGDTSHATQGNGLGLALVKRVIDILQGQISVESAPGKGTTFTVRIRRV